jgi:hypothetical protein
VAFVEEELHVPGQDLGDSPKGDHSDDPMPWGRDDDKRNDCCPFEQIDVVEVGPRPISIAFACDPRWYGIQRRIETRLNDAEPPVDKLDEVVP